MREEYNLGTLQTEMGEFKIRHKSFPEALKESLGEKGAGIGFIELTFQI